MPSFFFHITIALDAVCLENDRQTRYDSKPSNTISADARPVSSISRHSLCVPDSGWNSVDLGIKTQGSIQSDWRYDKITTQDLSMSPALPGLNGEDGEQVPGNISKGISAGSGGLATKGRYKSLNSQQEDLGWGVVRLYRDNEETPGLYDDPGPQKSSKHGRQSTRKGQDVEVPFRDEDCTTLCILAVPSYLTPSDFLGFVGEKTRNEVSHFRMIRTERGNRYMVLMKFRNGRKAREWRRGWNGKPFDGMEVGRQSVLLPCSS